MVSKNISPILSGKNLTKKFGGLVAVNNVSIEVERLGVTSVIGPNGAGKSTLFNLLSGSFSPDSGNVFLNEENISNLSPASRLSRGMARSFKITNLFFDLSVDDNLMLACQRLESSKMLVKLNRFSEQAIARSDELIRDFQLESKRQELAGALSHGEQRRLEIAVTMAMKPELLMLDEPTQGMSHSDTIETSNLISELGQKVTILLIEHDVELVMNLSKKVVVMALGSKIAEGEPESVRRDPLVQTAYFGESLA